MAATPAVDALIRRGTAHSLHEYTHDPAASYGQEAAAAVGANPARVFKTLVTAFAGGLANAVIPVSTELDLKAMAAALGVKKVTMAQAVMAERATGYVVGGISPLGQRRRLPTIVDESAPLWPTVFVSGGRRGLEIELTPADLVALTGASLVQVARAPTRQSRHASTRSLAPRTGPDDR